MSKSYVSMEQKVCIVCGKPYDTNAILMDRRLKDSMEQHTITGWGMCPEDEEKSKQFIALVEVDPVKTSDVGDPACWYRTGRIAHIKASAAKRVFDISKGDGLVFPCQPELMNYLMEVRQQ